MALLQRPPFIFQISEVRQDPQTPIRWVDGEWHPPLDLGTTQYSFSGTWGKYYLCDATNLRTLSSLPPGWAEYGTCTVYTDGSDSMWSVPMNATLYEIPGGEPDTSEDDGGDDSQSHTSQGTDCPRNFPWANWRPLCFQHLGRLDPSILTHGGEHERLHVKRRDQIWVEKLFPCKFRAKNTSSTAGRGGLAGEIRLIIALIALSASYTENAVEEALIDCMSEGQWPWSCPRAPTASGWERGRGVVVTVYYVPAWEAHYPLFESGACGKFFS